MTIALWIFPPEDFEAWCRLVGTPQVNDFAEYMAMIAAIQADQERQGNVVKRVGMLVAEMIAKLCDRLLDNTPANRAMIVAEAEPMRFWNEAVFDFCLSRNDGQPLSDLDCSTLMEIIINWAAGRNFSVGGGFHEFLEGD